MFLHPFNEFECNIQLKAESPVLIKESRLTDELRQSWQPDQELRNLIPNAVPISRATDTTLKNALASRTPLSKAQNLPYFIPASSLRGVFRSHLERALRGNDSAATPKICDPFDDGPDFKTANAIQKEQSTMGCSFALDYRRKHFRALPPEEAKAEGTPYQNSCPACRLFGNTLQASRLTIGDGEVRAMTVVERQHIRIDRRKGSVLHGSAPLRFYGLQDGTIHFRLLLRNFELSHIRLLGVLLVDLLQGNVTIGSGRSKGYGRVTLDYAQTKLHLRYFGPQPPDGKLRGVAEHPDSTRANWYAQRYGVRAAKLPDLTLSPWTNGPNGIPWIWESPLAIKSLFDVLRAIPLGFDQTQPLHCRIPGGA